MSPTPTSRRRSAGRVALALALAAALGVPAVALPAAADTPAGAPAGAPAGTPEGVAAETHLVRTVPGSAAQVADEVAAAGELVRVLPAVDVVVARLSPAAAARLEGHPQVAAVTRDARMTPTSLTDVAGGLVDATPLPALADALVGPGSPLAEDLLAPLGAGPADTDETGASPESDPAYNPRKDRYSALRTGTVTGARSTWRDTRAGAGVDVALIDSGIAPVPGLDAPGQVLPGPDLSLEQGRRAPVDTFGHGTHMAGIIAGRDAGPDPAVDPGSTDRFLGIAPGARLVPVKVADRRGTTDVSQVVAAFDWLIRFGRTDGRNVRVVNLAFGTDSLQPYQLDPLAHAAERAWHAGMVVVVSTGNGDRDRVSDPAYDPYVLAVGAVDSRGTRSTSDDVVPYFSNRGDGVRDPDLLAPGVHQQSLRAPGSRIDEAYGETGRLAGRFFRGNGTSQSTAAVSGAAALLIAQRPELEPDQVKALLRATARPVPAVPARVQGAGVVDVAAAAAAPTPSRDSARQTWPRALGTGSLAAARGTAGDLAGRVVGELGDDSAEVVAQSSDPLALAAAPDAAAGRLTGSTPVHTWAAGTFGGPVSDGTTWDGTTWNGTTWKGTTWNGTTWKGTTWNGTTWNGTTWNGTTWNGTTWNGAAWD